MKKELQEARIPGFEGYSIFSDGTVVGKFKRPLKPHKDRDGYLVVSLLRDGNISKRFVHRLVAQAFIPNPEAKPTVNHINGDKADNRVENLEWATQGENNSHAYKTNLAEPHRIQGAKNGRAKLTDSEVSEIRKRLQQETPEALHKIAEDYGVTTRIIANIRDNKTYKNSLQ